MNKLNCAFCLLGPPASGKGTIGAALQKKFDYPSIIPGDIYRRIREEQTELGEMVRDALKDGGYCPDWLTNKIMIEEGSKMNKPFILDGYPRTESQFQHLIENFEVSYYLHFDAPFEQLIKAATNRIQCNKCMKVWSKLLSLDECCECKNKEWKERFDDSAEMYPKRYETYNLLTQPIISMVEKLPNYKKFQNLNNPNVFDEVLEFLIK
jgi:adenylate kinase family enzyme